MSSRKSFSNENFLSPIAITTSPKAKDAQTVQRIVQNGDSICRVRDTDLNMNYLKGLLRDPDIHLWTIRDSQGFVFGFALTSSDTETVHLHLICTVKRKGEGSSLFAQVLSYSARTQKAVMLEAISLKVAKVYFKVASQNGWKVKVSGKLVSTETDVEVYTSTTGNTPMKFELHAVRGNESTAQIQRMAKMRARMQ